MEIRPFSRPHGVLRGDTLASFLFIVRLDYAFKKSLDLGTQIFALHSHKGEVKVNRITFV